SPAMVSDREAWSELTAAWLKEAVDAELPVLGVCYGHQLLAHGLGGKVDYHPQGREIGTWRLTLQEAAASDALFQACPKEFKVHLTHAQSVVELPPGAQLLASTEFEPCQAFRIGRQAWGVQFHPEFNEQSMREYVTTFGPRLREEGKNPEPCLAAVADPPEAGRLLERFASVVLEQPWPARPIFSSHFRAWSDSPEAAESIRPQGLRVLPTTVPFRVRLFL